MGRARINNYTCKMCLERGKKFSGTRSVVRNHLKEHHNIKGKDIAGNSFITTNTIVEELR